MVPVQIDGIHCQADEAVVKRMQDYADTMNKALKAYEELKSAVINVRCAQREYFKTRDTRILARSKEAEQLLDELLKGKKDKVEQKQLFL